MKQKNSGESRCTRMQKLYISEVVLKNNKYLHFVQLSLTNIATTVKNVLVRDQSGELFSLLRP